MWKGVGNGENWGRVEDEGGVGWGYGGLGSVISFWFSNNQIITSLGSFSSKAFLRI